MTEPLATGDRVRYNARTGHPYAHRNLHGAAGTIVRRWLDGTRPHAQFDVTFDGDSRPCHSDELTKVGDPA